MFDYHTMFFGMLFVLLGAQVGITGLFAKVYSHTERFDRGNLSLNRWLKRLSLESGLLAGGVLAVVGFAGDAWVVWQWARTGFSELHHIRAVIFWSLWLFLGVQIVFASFFLSMLGISRGTYVGDYDRP
jgi:hypothetical protein